MAYVNKGTSETTETTFWKKSRTTTIDNKVTTIKLDANYACCFVFKNLNKNIKQYEFRCFLKNTDKYKYEFKGTTTTTRIYTTITSDGEKTEDTSTIDGEIAIPQIGFNEYNNYTDNWIYSTNIPVFDDESSFQKYFKSGDVSGQVILYNTDWTLFIDGSQNPLYKLTWNCHGINDLDVSNSFIKLWVGKYDSFLGTVTNVSPFKEVAYSEGRCKFTFADISKLVEQPTIGHNPACLLMQLGYREFVTGRIETSTKMGVNLYFDKSSIQTMYDNLGYFTVVDGVIKKTTSGDGSTLTVKDGKDGSDGYTSDDDGGYDNGKDDDEADGESKDISAGIGVLTTTFKMTKERLQQLGQFLWGSSIFDKFSLINNNPIENIVSCKAIPIEQSGTNQQIVLGNVETGVNGEKISNNFGKKIIGTITIEEYYKNSANVK